MKHKIVDNWRQTMTKTDCFGYDEKKCGCKILKKLYCENKECNFYKTKERIQKEKKKYEV